MDDVGAKTAAVDFVGFHIGYGETVAREQRLERGERVVFQMLVADRVEGVAFQDQRQIMHFDDPGAIFHQQAGDIGDELIGIFEIVEHGDGGDDAKLFTGDEPGGEEVGNDAIGAVGGFAGEIFGRLESDAADAFGGVRAQEGTVVAADIEDAIAAAESGKVRGFFGDVREGGAHGGADAGLVPVMGIEPFGRGGVAQLREAASAAEKKIERDARPAVAIGKSAKLET